MKAESTMVKLAFLRTCNIVSLMLCIHGSLVLPAVAKPIGVVSTEEILNEADVVCKGTSQTSMETFSKESTRLPNGYAEAIFEVEYCFKGTLPSSRVTVHLPLDPQGLPEAYIDLSLGSLVLFLRVREDGSLVPHPAIGPQSTYPVSSKPVSPPEVGLFAAELDDEGAKSRMWLWQEFRQAVVDTSIPPQWRRDCIKPLVDLAVSDTELRAILVRLSADENDEIMAAALSARIRHQDVEALDSASELLNTSTLGENIERGLASAMRDVRAVECINRLAVATQSEKDYVAEGASYALRHIDSDQVVPILVGALDSPNLKVAYNAMMGLYRLEKSDKNVTLPGSDYAPGVDIFLSSPTSYLNNWRNWWTKTGRVKYADVLDGN